MPDRNNGKENFHHFSTKVVFSNAKRLRIRSTEAERILWEYLRDRRLDGKKFRRQHVTLNYIIDFYCHEHKLGIELDGGIHHNPMNKEYDRLRQKNIEVAGMKIIRFNNSEVIKSLEKVLQTIRTHLK